MTDNVTITPGSGATIASDDVAGVQFQRVKVTLGGDGVDGGDVAAGNPLPVSGPLTDAQLRATPVPVSGAVTISDGSGPVTVDGTVAVSGSVGVTGPLTDGQLRATPVPISGAVTISDGSGPVTVDGAVTVSGTVTATGPLTDAQLRATSVPTRVAAYTYPISTANSSTAQLAAGATFTGTIESPQDLPSISILLTSDQPITLTVRQFIDGAGVFAAPDIVFYVRAGQGFARSLSINGNFVQVTARNTGGSTTTTFNLNVAFGVLGDADGSGVLPVTELPIVLTGAAAQTATVNNILEPTAGANPTGVSGYRSASVQVVSTGTAGTFIFEQSNDGVNWRPLPVFNAELVTGVPITAAITATASQIIYTFPLRGNFLRLRIASTITGGSIQAFTRLSTEPWTPSAALVASNTAANMQTTAVISGNPVLGAGANAIGDVGMQVRANATGAASFANVLSPTTPAGQVIKGSAGRLLGGVLVNTNASARFLKVFNQTTITPGTTAANFEIVLPPNVPVDLNVPEAGLAFATGIVIMITAAQGLTNNGAITGNEVTGFVAFA